MRESLHFSAAHFTIFSDTERESLHGHNFRVNAGFTADVRENGLCFDYGEIKQVLQQMCDALDEKFLVPAKSPYLKIKTGSTNMTLIHNEDEISVPLSDVKLMPLRNITVEELASHFTDTLATHAKVVEFGIRAIELRVASGSGQWGVVRRDLT